MAVAKVRSQAMQRLRVIYLTEPHIDPKHVIDAIGPDHDLAVYNAEGPLEAQFERADVVIDSGGTVGTVALDASWGNWPGHNRPDAC